MQKTIDYATLTDKAVRYLAIREHSQHELRTKLRTTGAEADIIDQVLGEMQTAGWLSDERYTEHYIRSRMAKGQGPLRIRAELTTRGIAAELIETGLAVVEDDWEEQLATVAQRKFGSRTQDRKEQARQARFLTSRGFPESMIRRYLWDSP